jgi:hypothetical protein
MPRIVIALIFALPLALAACVADPDSTSTKHTPPQDPPDYRGVPTDTRPPSMLDSPAVGQPK